MTTVSEPAAITALLQDDIRGEHAAIMQYLQHAYRLEGGELPSDIEEIAREEMRHFRWIGEMIVDLGGSPTIERDPIFLEAPSDIDLLRLDIDAEDRAIAQYRDHIERIDSPKVVRLLERILADELAHRQKFGGFVEGLGGTPTGTAASGIGPWGGGPTDAEVALDAPATGSEISQTGPVGGSSEGAGFDSAAGAVDPGEPIPPHVRLIERLNSDIRVEYAAILRQLHLSFMTKDADPKLSQELLESHAQWHMKHLGWLSERVIELGGTAEHQPDPVLLDGDPRQRLSRELKEQGEQVARARSLHDDAEDEETRFLLGQIVTHDAFAAEQLVDLLAETPETPAEPRPAPSPAGRLTVGSLLGQRQP